MDDRRFDALTKSLASGSSRRSLIKGLLGLAGLATTGAIVRNEVDAARRGSSGPSAPTPPPLPTAQPTRTAVPTKAPSCPGRQVPCDGGCCCPAGETKCGPACCPAGATCCDNACCYGECYGEELCCPAGNVVCAGVACCAAGEVCAGGRCQQPSPTSTSTPTSTPTPDPCAGVECNAGPICFSPQGTCDPSTGQCVYVQQPIGFPCGPCDACDSAGTCQSLGECCSDDQCPSGRCEEDRTCCVETTTCDALDWYRCPTNYPTNCGGVIDCSDHCLDGWTCSASSGICFNQTKTCLPGVTACLGTLGWCADLGSCYEDFDGENHCVTPRFVACGECAGNNDCPAGWICASHSGCSECPPGQGICMQLK
jgi:hypothetical protein